MRLSDAMFGSAGLFPGVVLYQFFTCSFPVDPTGQTLAHVRLAGSMLLSLCVYLGAAGLIVAIRWSQAAGTGQGGVGDEGGK